MITTLEHKPTETPEEAKARRNAEYTAKLERSFQQSDRGEVISMTFEEWEKKFGNVQPELH
jgi:hypothetical protein